MNNEFSQAVPVARQLLTGCRAAAVLLVLCGLLYTGAATVLGGLLFPHQATGSLLARNGQPIGSELVAQPFASPHYFYGRPSAAGYDPTATGGSNLAPSNPELRSRVRGDGAFIQAMEGVAADAIPVDLLAASGAGLDPHISPAAARLQAPRIAAARGWQETTVLDAIEAVTAGRQWGFLVQPRVNVLALNLLLDRESAAREKRKGETQ